MRSLKRCRIEDTPQGRDQKRTCSNPLRVASTFRDEVNSPRINLHLPTNTPAYCDHKTSSSCSLSLPVCCACADKRPTSSTYIRYVDGKGDTRNGTRCMDYCPGCQVYSSTFKKMEHFRNLSLPLSEVDIPAERIRVTCANQTFELLRSDDFTLEDLRNKVAQLMWCNPNHVAVVATDLDLNTGVQSIRVDTALFKARVKHVHFRLVYDMGSDEDDKNDVDMEDVGY